MKNEEILKENDGKKFDIVLMNPPYGNRNTGDEFIHHKFVEKCLDLTNILICIMPAKLCMYDTSKDKNRAHYKEVYNDRLTEVEAVDSKVFTGTAMMTTAIHTFEKTNNGNIHLINLDKSEKNINSLFDLSQFNDYEKNIAKYLEIDIKEANCYLCPVSKNYELLNKWGEDFVNKHGKKIYVTSNSANGAMNAKWFSKTVGNIFDNINDLKQNFKDRKGAQCVIMIFDSVKEAENCRDAMKRPLLRWVLYRSQDDQSLRRKVYKYIPNIDWGDDRVKTDEGLLEVCGCPKDKCKEYADYCKKIIDGKKFDICLMNPPYSGNTHLKFLEKVIEISDKVISIQPCRWLQETVSKKKKNSQYNKYKQSISEHIRDFEIIDFDTVLKLFNVQSTELAIYYCDKEGGYDYDKISSNNIVERVLDYIENNLCDIENNKKDGYRVRISLISGMSKNIKNLALKDIVFKDGKYNDKWWYNYYQKNGSSKITEEIPASLKFNTEKEGYNFINSFKTDFVKYIESHLITDVNISDSKILWMGNAKHPRTGNICYIDEWTNKDFYEFFNLTGDEIKEIEKYKNK